MEEVKNKKSYIAIFVIVNELLIIKNKSGLLPNASARRNTVAQ